MSKTTLIIIIGITIILIIGVWVLAIDQIQIYNDKNNSNPHYKRKHNSVDNKRKRKSR